MTSVNAIVNLSISGQVTGNTVLGNAPQYPLSMPGLINMPMTNGSGSFKVNQAVVYSQSLAPGASVQLSMFNLGATDEVGNVVTMQSVKTLVIQNLANTGTNPPTESDLLKVTGGTSSAWTLGPINSAGTLTVNGGANAAFFDAGAQGYACYGTNSTLLFTAPSTNPDTITFNLVALGATATQ